MHSLLSVLILTVTNMEGIKLTIVYIFLCACADVNSKRILALLPTPSISHQVVFRPLMQELVKRGHEVIAITPDPVYPKGSSLPNYTEIDVHDISYDYWKEKLEEYQNMHLQDNANQMKFFTESVAEIFKSQMLAPEVQKIINGKQSKFDLLFLEACIRPSLILSHVFPNTPVIQVSSLGLIPYQVNIVGAPYHPFLYPSFERRRLYNLSIWEKITELYNHVEFDKTIYSLQHYEENMLKDLFESDVPSITELERNVDMIFLNVNPMWMGNQPMPQNVIYLGGLHQKERQPLPQDLTSYLDSSKNGTIYVSFGTNVQSSHLRPERINILLNVLSNLPYNILWKWDNDELPGKGSNIKISKWFPQSDLLRHPNIKLFITQGGLQSTDEAITAGVPLIGIPMLGDQWYNVEKYVYFKIGKRLDLETLTESNLRQTIKDVIEDKSYRENIVRLRNMMEDQPETPLERAVWWTEYVMRHGGAKHLRSPAANISWRSYFELDLVLILLAILTICIIIVTLILKTIWKRFLRTYLGMFKVKNN